MEHYKVISEMDGTLQCYYICETETLEMVLEPSRYLMHKTMSNKSPNTVRRNAYSLAAYLEYLRIENKTADQVTAMEYEEQSSHFVNFLHWLKDGNHREIEEHKIPNNGTCNAYLKDVCRFYLFMEMQGKYESLKVLYYDSFTTLNSAGAKRRLRYRAFKGYLKEEERKVRAAEQNEILTLLKACTNCRDQLLILLAAETGYRIGEILGIDYTKDIDFKNHTIRIYFRDDNENGARAKNAEYRRAKVSKETFEFLMYYLAEYRKLLQSQQLLFINIAGDDAGKALDVDAVYSMFRRMEHKTGIKVTPHMLRRYFAVMRRKAGWRLEMISEALGHKHLETTIKYLNIVDDELLEASDAYYAKHSALYNVQQLL